MQSYINRLEALSTQLQGTYDAIRVHRICATGVEAEKALGAGPDLDAVTTRVESLLSEGIELCLDGDFNAEPLYKSLPSFAHSGHISRSGRHPSQDGDRPLVDDALPQGVFLPNWWEVPYPHPNSSRLSRFRLAPTAVTATQDTSVAAIVSQARCEIVADPVCVPTGISSSRPGTPKCFAIPARGGHKDRSPILHYYLPDIDGWKQYTVDVGLADVAYHSAVDGPRRLIFVGDDDRIKSYTWGSKNKNFEDAHPTHTLSSSGYRGPMVILNDDRLLRAGTKRIGVWTIDQQPTHGRKGTKTIGRRMNPDYFDSWRDDPEEIEYSTGSDVTNALELSELDFQINQWTTSPSSASSMICSASSQRDSAKQHRYSCRILDLNTGVFGSRFLGHGFGVEQISTSTRDGNTFGTACNDGHARLFDIRQTYPVLTFDVGDHEDVCSSIALAHPDGIPLLFTGTERHEHIKVWDVRARSILYDLGTGNNQVGSLLWDDEENTLWATTACDHITRFGERMDYRRAIIPKPPKPPKPDAEDAQDIGMDSDSEDEDEDEDDDEFDYDSNGNFAVAKYGPPEGNKGDESNYSTRQSRYREKKRL
ncbi:hypothetical protein AX16_010127 [Volvariella volvacea WC 439]|nr:hypothetical protein AX16_010127 [Volvariella volvacea WC 439]